MIWGFQLFHKGDSCGQIFRVANGTTRWKHKTFCRCPHNNYHHRQRAAEICGQHGAIVPRVDSKPTGRGLRDSLALFYRFRHRMLAVMVVCVIVITTMSSVCSIVNVQHCWYHIFKHHKHHVRWTISGRRRATLLVTGARRCGLIRRERYASSIYFIYFLFLLLNLVVSCFTFPSYCWLAVLLSRGRNVEPGLRTPTWQEKSQGGEE